MEKKQKAFTLIELLVVVGVIGILAAATIPMFSGNIDKAHQGRSYAYQGQIRTLVGTDCLFQGYSCGVNLVPNWAFSDGDTGEWTLTGTDYDIRQYKLYHDTRSSSVPDYITVPLLENIEASKVYRVDVVARDVTRNSAQMYGAGFIGFSLVGSGIGGHARIGTEDNHHICDVFRPQTDNAPIRLFVSARAEVAFDEVSIREVSGYTDVTNNSDCSLEADLVAT